MELIWTVDNVIWRVPNDHVAEDGVGKCAMMAAIPHKAALSSDTREQAQFQDNNNVR